MDVNTQGAWANKSSSPPDLGWLDTASTPSCYEDSAAVILSSPQRGGQSTPSWLLSPRASSTSAAAMAVTSGSLSANFWQQPMPAFTSGSYPPGTGSGLSRESSRDDLTSVELEQVFEYEERFRVDRRKLELLILGRFDPIKETAVDFFQKIGVETSTTVIWPSRLKVGAKSKKDPHIRIGGQEDAVIVAKNLIMDHLDTKSRRVTIKMDVSYTDHSHIIGKGGNTIRRVMSETGCHIHFPDSNRSNPNEKSNQVSIAGRELDGVEMARARVRELTPLIFTFDLPIVSSVEVNLDSNDPFLRTIQDQYNIQLMFRQKQKNFHTSMAVVKGCEWEAARVKEATLLLIDHLCGVSSNTPTSPAPSPVSGSNSSGPNVNVGYQHPSNSVAFPVTMNLEISPVHHTVVVGKNNFNLRVIMQRTNTTILFPDAADPNIPAIRKGSVSITGAIHNVYSARQQLIGSLPLVMMFDVPEDLEVIDSEVHKIGEELNVAISIKPKHRQGCKSVLIKAQERNASSIYAARHRLLKMDDDEELLVVADVPESYKTQPLPQHVVESMTGMNQDKKKQTAVSHSSLMFPAPASSSPSINNYHHFVPPPNPPLVPPYIMPNQASWTGATATAGANFGNVLTPNHPYLQDYALLVLNNITRLQHQQQSQSVDANNPGRVQQHSSFDPNNNWKAELNNNNNLAMDGQKNSFNSPSPRSLQARVGSPRTSSSPNMPSDNGNLARTLDMTEKMMQQFCLDEVDKSVGNVAAAAAGNTQTSPDSNSFFSQDRRAPGCEMKSMQKQMDYDQKRLLATRAIQNKPVSGEPRTPTPSWVGLGFSNSMPDQNAIREKQATKLPEEPSTAQAAANFKFDDPIFGNSSAFDAFIQQNKANNIVILPSDDLPTVLAKNGLAKYTDLFVRHEVDLQTFASLTDLDLREVGIQTFGARKKLLHLINKIKHLMNENWRRSGLTSFDD